MANSQGPFGAVQVGSITGGPVNFAVSGNPPYRIASNYATAIGFGDLVTLVAATPTGYINRWTAGAGSASVQAAGIFYGCKYYSTSQKKVVWNNYWPGSDATGDVEAFVCSDPMAQFMIQAYSTAIGQEYVGCTADVNMGTVNTTTGLSGMALITPSTTGPTLLPFKVLGIVTTPPGAPGTDSASSYNNVIVGFNNMVSKTLATIDT